jgi:flagellar basal body P-ring formation protein FlgA
MKRPSNSTRANCASQPATAQSLLARESQGGRQKLGSFRLIAILVIWLAGSVQLGFAQGIDDRHMVTITLQPKVQVDETVVYLDQIARLEGGSAGLRQKLARLDVAEFKFGVEQLPISADQVRFRLLLAGVQANQFRLTGATRVVVIESDDPISARKILGAAAQTLRARHAQLGQPRDVILPVLKLHPLDKIRLEAKVPTTPQPSGAARADVSILVNGRMREIVPVVFDLEKEPAARVDPKVRSASMVAPANKGEILIKNRDLVRIVVIIGGSQIVATGEAQQDGKLGETIRVRNTESNRIVNGRVETRDVVLVAEY